MPPNIPEILVTHDPSYVGRKAAEEFTRTAQRAVQSRGKALIALSGGTTARHLLEVLTSDPFVGFVPWDRTEIFWSDERFLPGDNDASNHGSAVRNYLNNVADPRCLHLPPVDADTPQAGAAQYEATVRAISGVEPPEIPRFDLIFLGLGEDAHVASLFPGEPALEERTALVSCSHGPSPARDRITFTPPLLWAARQVAILVCGSSKAPVVKRVLETPPDPLRCPAQLLEQAEGRVGWILDRAAAAEILPKDGSGPPSW